MSKQTSPIPAPWPPSASGTRAGMGEDCVSHPPCTMVQRRRADRPQGGAVRLLVLLCTYISLFLPSPSPAGTPGGTPIDNSARVSYSDAGGTERTIFSNMVRIVTAAVRTPSRIEFLTYAPSAGGSEGVVVQQTEASVSADPSGPFAMLPAPTPAGGASPLPLGIAHPLLRSDHYHVGTPLFLRLTDRDQNADPAAPDTVLLTVRSSLAGDRELLRLQETGPDTGTFVGYLMTTGSASTPGDGLLGVLVNEEISARYVDISDGTDLSVGAALVDPYGTIFDSRSGRPLDGAVITLLEAATGRPATVFGDNGTSAFPATVTSGTGAVDGGGQVYRFPPGSYRFPFVPPGSYRLAIVPPAGYAAPSAVDDATLQILPGAPYALGPGSRGAPFFIDPGPALRIDIPADPAQGSLWLAKHAGKEVAGIGDFIPYRLEISNGDPALPAEGVTVVDRLPASFRYQKGSAQIDGTRAADPLLSADGRTLTFTLGNLPQQGHRTISYVAAVGASARPGTAVNTAIARSAAGLASNTAAASVIVREELLRSRSFIAGRVTEGDCAAEESTRAGLKGVRIFLEDGTVAVTDEDGRYHFEGVTPERHVVQLDLGSLPPEYEVLACEENTRFAGRASSQFVDIQPGTLWRADFQVGLRPRAVGDAVLDLRGRVEDGEIALELPLALAGVDLRNLRLSVILPDGLAYLHGSARLDGQVLTEPQILGSALNFRLGDREAPWSGSVALRAAVTATESTQLPVKAVLTFDSPQQRNQRTPMADILLFPGRGDGAPQEQSGPRRTETVGLRPGEAADPAPPMDGSSASSAMPVFDPAWLAKAAPGLEWLWPRAGEVPAIPSIKVAIKHPADLKVTLHLAGAEISPLAFEGTVRSPEANLAVSTWRGIGIDEGDNRFTVTLSDARGNTVAELSQVVHHSSAPVRAELVEEESVLVADGRTPPVIAVRLLDRDGYPACEGTVGEYSIAPPHRPWTGEKSETDALAKKQTKFRAGPRGIARIPLEPTARSGEVLLHLALEERSEPLRAWLKPQPRDWILVGLAEGTAGYNTVSGNMEALSDADQDEDFYRDGRVAFFAKGKIRGSWLLTLAYDSDKRGQNSLHQTIDPDSYYTLYGDASSQQYEAASARKLYVKLERDQLYALFGDFDTGLTVTELARYNRSLNGFKSEFQGRLLRWNLFAADTDQAFVKDELSGDGTSGLYRLTRSNLVVNSEKVTIETRDRFHSETVLSSRPLARHLDYNIDYDRGTLYFKEPVFTRDQNFNPIYIVVDYEAADPGDRKMNYGGRAALTTLGRSLEAGASYIHEGTTGLEGDLYAADLTVKLKERTTFKGEVARSKVSADRGDKDGTAYVAEIAHEGADLRGRLYLREERPGFGLGQQNMSEQGMRKYGVAGNYRLTQPLSAAGEISHQRNLATGAERDVGEAQLSFSEKRYSLSTGLRLANDHQAGGSINRSTQALFGAGLQATRRLGLNLQHEQSLGGRNASADYPTRTLAGADFRLTERLTLFARQEITRGEAQKTDSSRLGLRATPWSGAEAHSAIEQQVGENGARVFANLGLRQTWQVTRHLSLDAGLDRNQTLRRPGYAPINPAAAPASGSSEDFTAISVGGNWTEEKWSCFNRAEYRTSDSEEKWGLSAGTMGEVRSGLGLSARGELFLTRAAEDTAHGSLRLGLAWRPRARWIVLNRLDYLYDRQEGEDNGYNNWRLVNNLHANLKMNRRTQLAMQYGIKYVQENIAGINYSSVTDLAGFEGRYDLSRDWDVGVRFSMLHAWDLSQIDYSSGFSVGCQVVENAWVSLGYNFTGFEDKDFSRADYTAQGPFLRFRVKFDQTSVREALRWLGNI